MSLIWVIIALAVGFVIILVNNKRNQRKLRDRKGRNFRENYEQKKKNRGSDG